jgi:hypothetical protein
MALHHTTFIGALSGAAVLLVVLPVAGLRDRVSSPASARGVPNAE